MRGNYHIAGQCTPGGQEQVDWSLVGLESCGKHLPLDCEGERGAEMGYQRWVERLASTIRLANVLD